MRRLAYSVAILLLAVTTFGAVAQQDTFRSSGVNGAMPGRYRVSVELMPGDELDTISRQLAATYGGRLEPYLETGFVGFAIALTETRARLLSRDPRVVAVEEMEARALVVPPAPAPLEGVSTQSAVPPAVIATEAISGFGTYTYDGSGNITSIGEGTSKDTFLYDQFGRLKSATLREGPAQTYTYDRYGNILTVVTAGDSVTKKLGVDRNTNQIDQPFDENGQPNNVVASYDLRGNLTSYFSSTFVFDGLDMIKEATVDGVRRFHLYSATDERVVTIKVLGPNLVGDWTIRDPGGRVLRRFTDTNGTFAWTEDYIYRGGELLAAAVPGPEKIRHFHLDHLGTPRLITGNGGAQLAQHHYHPFGPELPSSTNDGEKAKFTGHERDAASLDYMHARFYNPDMGRFLSVDPGRADLKKPQSWNRYSYTMNNPINNTDPDGRETNPVTGQSYILDSQILNSRNNPRKGFFGMVRRNSDGTPKKHGGNDIAAPRGTPVFAPVTGTVVQSGWAGGDGGNVLRIRRANDENGQAVYVHISHLNAAPSVKVGDKVVEGQPNVAEVGNTGNAKNEDPHAHTSVMVGGQTKDHQVDPQQWFRDHPSNAQPQPEKKKDPCEPNKQC